MTDRILLVLLLTGCAQTPAARFPTASNDAAVSDRSIGACRVDGVASLIGRPVTPALIALAKKRARVRQVRTIAAGDIVTADYRMDRLNLDVDANGLVAKLRCG